MTIRPSKRPSELTRTRAKDSPQQRYPTRTNPLVSPPQPSTGQLEFRRQHPIEPFIVDFYCAEARLIIELDGESHNGREEYDLQRSKHFQSIDLTVFRITNDEVLGNLAGVAEAILKAAYTKLGKPLP